MAFGIVESLYVGRETYHHGLQPQLNASISASGTISNRTIPVDISQQILLPVLSAVGSILLLTLSLVVAADLAFFVADIGSWMFSRYYDKHNPGVFEALLLCILAVGVVAQCFHTPGSLYEYVVQNWMAVCDFAIVSCVVLAVLETFKTIVNMVGIWRAVFITPLKDTYEDTMQAISHARLLLFAILALAGSATAMTVPGTLLRPSPCSPPRDGENPGNIWNIDRTMRARSHYHRTGVFEHRIGRTFWTLLHIWAVGVQDVLDTAMGNARGPASRIHTSWSFHSGGLLACQPALLFGVGPGMGRFEIAVPGVGIGGCVHDFGWDRKENGTRWL